MLLIVKECQKVSEDILFFSIDYPKPLTIEDFETQQSQTLHSVANYLKSDWVNNISDHMKTCLKHIGKGWFDLSQKDYYIYNVMKLKRLMDLIKQRMQVQYLLMY